jgi:hypothetical protein
MFRPKSYSTVILQAFIVPLAVYSKAKTNVTEYMLALRILLRSAIAALYKNVWCLSKKTYQY